MARAERLNGSPSSKADHPGFRYTRDRELDLWFAQNILSLFSGLTGGMKGFLPPAAPIPGGLLRFAARAELMAALRIVVPSLCRVLAWLAHLAAANFASLQALTNGPQTFRGEFAVAWALNLALFALSIFVLWGRIIQASGRADPRRDEWSRQRPARDLPRPS